MTELRQLLNKKAWLELELANAAHWIQVELVRVQALIDAEIDRLADDPTELGGLPHD
jgi:hypothetical protein